MSCMYDSVSPADKAHLLSVSSAWLSVVPSLGINEPLEFHTAIKWWLGIPVGGTHSCPYCPSHALDPHNHHALTCKYRGDVVNWHNRLRDILLESCHRASLNPKMEAGCDLGHEGHRTRPADILVPNWELGRPGALDLTITSPLNLTVFSKASVSAGSAAQAAESRKHQVNNEKCQELGWACIPLAIETYGCWGTEARQCLCRIANHLAVRMGWSVSKATTSLYGRLSLALIRANARAILSRTVSLFEHE